MKRKVAGIANESSFRRDVFRLPSMSAENSFSKLLLITLLLLKYIRLGELLRLVERAGWRDAEKGSWTPFKISPNQHKLLSHTWEMLVPYNSIYVFEVDCFRASNKKMYCKALGDGCRWSRREKLWGRFFGRVKSSFHFSVFLLPASSNSFRETFSSTITNDYKENASENAYRPDISDSRLFKSLWNFCSDEFFSFSEALRREGD